MPTRTLKIENGPGFRGFALQNGIVTDLNLDQVFTMDQELPEGQGTIHKDRKVFQMKLMMFGRVSGEDDSEFRFIGFMSWLTESTAMFYVGIYNTRDRKGVCEEIPKQQFFESDVMRLLFGTRTRT